ncbi:MAG: protein-L-isoaspartate(D-aspartate) O-methyltransferase [Myxococcales bacterium]
MSIVQSDGQEARESLLVRRLIDQGIRDARVLAAFARVPRRFFVPEEFQDESQADRPLDIGWGQTISQPFVVAAMTEALELKGPERVLEVGTGSGYALAILAELLPVNADVRGIEIIPELAERAERTLREVGYTNVQVRQGDGTFGWPEAAPFDAIMVSAAPRQVPSALLEQLAPAGRLVLPVGPTTDRQELQLWRRTPEGGFERRTLMQVRFVPLTGAAEDDSN